ncbi:MAG: hypothetical protein ILP02_01795, partial [Clostridia bacterium]|nr:hypothetical protein [Clostridia bacterium]
QIQAVFPVILTLIAASGATATSAAFQPSVAYVATFESVVAAKVLFPIVTLLFLFGAVTALSGFMNAGRMNDFFKSAFKWIAGATSVVFTFFMTATGIVASTYDGFSIKALKYVASGSVPIAGQFVGGGIEAVFAACVLIKNAIGALSLAAILLTVILPIIKIAVLSLLLRFLAATAEPIANGKTIKFISSSADALNYLAGIIISVAVVYFITLLIAVSALGGAA